MAHVDRGVVYGGGTAESAGVMVGEDMFMVNPEKGQAETNREGTRERAG